MAGLRREMQPRQPLSLAGILAIGQGIAGRYPGVNSPVTPKLSPALKAGAGSGSQSCHGVIDGGTMRRPCPHISPFGRQLIPPAPSCGRPRASARGLGLLP